MFPHLHDGLGKGGNSTGKTGKGNRAGKRHRSQQVYKINHSSRPSGEQSRSLAALGGDFALAESV